MPKTIIKMGNTVATDTIQVSINTHGPGKSDTSLPDLVKHKIMTKIVNNKNFQLLEKTDSADIKIKIVCRSHYDNNKYRIHFSQQIVKDGSIVTCNNLSLCEHANGSEIAAVSAKLFNHIKKALSSNVT